MARFLGFICCLFVCFVCVLSLSCMDDGGDPVDWWIALKHPDGTTYEYMDSLSSGLATSSHTMDNKQDGALARTLAQVYKYSSSDRKSKNKTHAKASSSYAYAKYNDEYPDGTTISSGGHMKGVIGFDSTSGFWLVHSVPKFPNTGDTYEGCCISTRYGQSFFCVSLPTSSMNDVGSQLQIDVPHVYDSSVPSALQNLAPSFYAMTQGTTNPSTPNGTLTLLTSGAQKLTSFAKNPTNHVQFYEAIVASGLNSPLMVESWQDGAGNLPSYCEPSQSFDVTTIETLKVSDGSTWKVSDDHAKWAITGEYPKTSAHQQIVCIGDINRQSSQAKRGGGTLCIPSSTVWQAFRGIITDANECQY